jgi:uncharacterized membrane protein YjjB (DUF3815 family)
MEWIKIVEILEKAIWFGFGGVGFAILFNVPVRTLFAIWLLAALGGIAKLSLLFLGANVILASLGGASIIGILSIPAAHGKHAPPLVFSIPAVIPMVPGVFAYRMMLGLIKLATDTTDTAYSQVLSDTVSNGIKALFILMSLAVGVAIPMLIMRKSSVKHFKMTRRVKREK